MPDTTTERRDANEQSAIESAFVAGKLPDDDRRHTSVVTEPPVKPIPAAPIPPAFGITLAQHQRSEAITKQIGLTIPAAELPHWHELLAIWGHR